MQSIPSDHPLRRHFAAAVEHTFCTEVGLCDPDLTDYLADLLVNFTHIDTLNTMRTARGKRLEQIARMLAAMADEQPINATDRDRQMYRHIGDYTLFWAGMYPENLRRSAPIPSDALHDYVVQGKQSYAIVADLAVEKDIPPPRLFRSLSEDFEYCLFGLGLVRKAWEHRGESGTEGHGEIIV